MADGSLITYLIYIYIYVYIGEIKQHYERHCQCREPLTVYLHTCMQDKIRLNV